MLVKNNDLDTVRLLLAHGADANLTKESKRLRTISNPMFAIPKLVKLDTEPSPLCIACKHGNVAIVDCLLQDGADVTFAYSDGNTPLHFAVQRLGEQANSEEYDPIVTLLLQHKAAVNVLSYCGETPLYVACMKGHAGVVKQLLDCRADVGLTTRDWNKYPLLIACEKNFRDIGLMLLKRRADANVSKDNQTPLKFATANGNCMLVKKLLTCGADANQMQNFDDTALHAAVLGCKLSLDNDAFVNTEVKIVQLLLKSGAEANSLNHSGETPLYLACKPTDYKVNVDIVQTLLEHGSDPNLCPSDVDVSPWLPPPLSAAAFCGNNELVMLLIKYGAKLDRSDTYGRTALHFAIGDMCFVRHLESTKSDTSTAEIHLLSAGAHANVTDKTGEAPPCLACSRGKTELVKLLLTRGCNPNTGTTDNYYPIHAAYRCQHYDSVKLLLEYNADVTVGDMNGKIALHYALESASYHSSDSDKTAVLVQLLLDRGANINATSTNGESPFYIVCSKGLASVAKKMLERGAKVDGNSGKKLPLNAACRNKHVSIVQLLLTHGADPNVSEEGYEFPCCSTLPLHIAAADDNIELVESLLKHGANVDGADTNGNTALHHTIEHYEPRATSSPYSDIVVASTNAKSVIDILLDNKADVNTVNSSGETPLYKAAVDM